MLAVTNGHADVVQVLVDSGANVDCTDKHFCTALHRAVSDVHVIVILCLPGVYSVYTLWKA